MELPPQVLRKILKPGSAFLFVEESFQGAKPHFFIVLNHHPQMDERLLMVNATTKIEKRRFLVNLIGAPETLVVVKPHECAFLKQESAFDCNYPILRTVNDLILKYQSKELKMVGEVTGDLLGKLRNGVLLSPLVDEATKKIIR